MKQYEAVVKVMEQNGGYATLGQLYERVLDVPDCEWKTKTPFASIRRIVQVHSDLFFKIKPGLWALTAWQDKNRTFLGKGTLGGLASLREIHPFSYPRMVGCAKTVDVVWFNERKMPAALFEVEHSTDMKNSLVKYTELQDFRTDMIIVADESRSRYFREMLTFQAFRAISKYARFLGYQQLSDCYTNLVRAKVYELRLGLPH